MKKQLAIAAVVGASVFAGVTAASATSEKVTICHAAGQEGTTHFETLEISENAVYGRNGEAGHFEENGTPRAGHEQDYFGPCTTEGTTTTEVSTTQTTGDDPTSTTTTTEIPTTTTTVCPDCTPSTLVITTTTTEPDDDDPTTTTTVPGTPTTTVPPGTPTTTPPGSPPASEPLPPYVPGDIPRTG